MNLRVFMLCGSFWRRRYGIFGAAPQAGGSDRPSRRLGVTGGPPRRRGRHGRLVLPLAGPFHQLRLRDQDLLDPAAEHGADDIPPAAGNFHPQPLCSADHR